MSKDTEQMISYVDKLFEKYKAEIEKIEKLDSTKESYADDIEFEVMTDFDMFTTFCDEEIDDKYNYALCEMLNRALRGVIYSVAIKR